MDKVTKAYNYMSNLIDKGIEFPDAHAMAVISYNLNDKDSQELIDLYDEECSNF